MRLFAAVLPPPAAVAELREVVQGLPHDEALRWTAQEGWHFTLAFMGEVGEGPLPELQVRLERAAGRTAPFVLRLHGSGRFAHRALWTGAAGDLDTLRLLAERADAAARRSGIPMEQHRSYHPHLTVARARTEVDLRPYVEAFAGFEGTPWPVEELHLVRSNLPGGGAPGAQPRYEVVGSWRLRG
ncbi:RNA 2',3'-cyclic phosphodiesterase [Streptomyces sp. WAC06614]|uniref:RNA 2',3'-cyclic phosphodiesterase n=1 Tax=Streptomyces sp. WAC06614 TaxID=2487416 RepID=UPI000F78113B|nr:RNA 2',3'-cyclic phosphodiesterase [Streptomyces sp. WAC06614]RSS78727.1 RNA 2',3'-cyclic phosphodiesterase [Streptomyces sp. WAC06614]